MFRSNRRLIGSSVCSAHLFATTLVIAITSQTVVGVFLRHNNKESRNGEHYQGARNFRTGSTCLMIRTRRNSLSTEPPRVWQAVR